MRVCQVNLNFFTENVFFVSEFTGLSDSRVRTDWQLEHRLASMAVTWCFQGLLES